MIYQISIRWGISNKVLLSSEILIFVYVIADLVDEFLYGETGARPKLKSQGKHRPPQTFRMDSILEQMKGANEFDQAKMYGILSVCNIY